MDKCWINTQSVCHGSLLVVVNSVALQKVYLPFISHYLTGWSKQPGDSEIGSMCVWHVSLCLSSCYPVTCLSYISFTCCTIMLMMCCQSKERKREKEMDVIPAQSKHM